MRWKTIDKIIFRTTKVRNRLILELMARGGMGIGEVLKLRLGDLQDRKLRPHDLRRHFATYASRSGVPIEIVSKA